MSEFIDKIKKGDVIYDVHDAERPHLDGTALVIPEQPGPEPVIEIDGVKYYHKQEFKFDDIDETVFSEQKCLNLLTGEIETSAPTTSMAKGVHAGGSSNYPVFQLFLNWPGYSFNVMGVENVYSPLNYTSRAFTVVDTLSEVTDDTKICLPTCSAYYGFLSEDGKTFISYYNLKSDGTPEYINSIKQGNAIIPLKDLTAGGTKLYKHVLHFNMTAEGSFYHTIVCTIGTQIDKNYISVYKNCLFGMLMGDADSILIGCPYPNAPLDIKSLTNISYKDDISEESKNAYAITTRTIQLDTIDSIDDTVTEL